MEAQNTVRVENEPEAAAAAASEALDPSIGIRVDNVTVAFRSYKERPTTLKESILNFVRTRKIIYYSTFNALSGVSFDVPRGRVFGLIGSNGAGKSTLLRALAGVLKPTQGSIVTRGSVDSLIQLGAGFDPELNAIENIYLNGSLHMQSKREIKERIPAILEFAELQEFATTPIKYYSSGMYARLGFSVAVDRRPDILLVDEVLAVGDDRFKDKCDRVFANHLRDGRTIVIVSHSMEMIEAMADQAVLLSRGKIAYLGDPKEAIRRYRDPSYLTALSSNNA